MKEFIKKHITDIVYIFGIIVLCYIFFFHCGGEELLRGGDMVDGHYEIWANNARIMHEGHFPLWNPNIWGGYSDVGGIHEVFYPILIILEFLCWDNVSKSLSFYIVPMYICIHYIIAGIGIYTIGRVRRINSFISFVSAAIAIFSGCFFFTSHWIYIFGGYCWSVWLILFLYLLAEYKKISFLIASSVIFAILGLSSPAQGVLFAVLIYCIMWISLCSLNKLKKSINIGLWYFVSGLIGIGLMGIQLFPFIESCLNSYRYIPGLTIEENTDNMKVPLDLFKQDVITSTTINGIFGSYKGVIAVSAFFIIFVLTSFFLKKKDDWLHVFAEVFLLICLFYSVGLIFPDIFWYIPGFNAIREPLLYSPFFVISGSILLQDSLVTYKECLTKNDINIKECLYCFKAWIVITAIIVVLMFLPHMLSGVIDFIMKAILIVWLLLVVINKKIKKHFLTVLFFTVVIFNYIAFITSNSSEIFFNYKEKIVDKAFEVNVLSQEAFREINDSVEDGKDAAARYLRWSNTDVLPANIAGIVGENDCFAYLNPINYNTFFFYQLANFDTRIQLQNIKYILIGGKADKEFLDYMSEVFKAPIKKTSCKVFADYGDREPTFLYYIDTSNKNIGCGWVANNIIEYNSSKINNYGQISELFEKINSDNIDLRKDCFVDIDSIDDDLVLRDRIEDNSYCNYSVECEEYNPNHIVYTVENDNSGIFVSSEYYCSGWNVVVDGRNAEILQVNYGFRGVFLQKGKHHVEFYYFPNSLKLGIVTMLISIVIIIFLLVLQKKTERSKYYE